MNTMTSESRSGAFHERFNVDVGTDEARLRFINRIENSVFDEMPSQAHQSGIIPMRELYRLVAYFLGIRTGEIPSLRTYVGDDFYRCLHVLEALHTTFTDTRFEEELSNNIEIALYASETDLGIKWESPVFVRTGAQLLDAHLINEPLRWLSDPKYDTVHAPFKKGLSHYLEAEKKSDRLTDAITDMYEAVEALAKIVNDNDRELSRNREPFIKSIKASDYHKQLLKDYIEYAGKFRHAARTGQPKPPLSEPEVESFIYLTGLFIRLAIRTTQPDLQ